jgi:hypothetical protein
MTHPFFFFAGWLLVAGPAWGALLFSIDDPARKALKQALAADKRAYRGNCIHCGDAINEHGQCPNLEHSGVRLFDRLRIYCGHAELRTLWKAGAA